MACFDVHDNPGGSGYLLDVQTVLLRNLNTRVVVPLLPETEAPLAAERLNPIFEVNAARVAMATHFMASIPAGQLAAPTSSLAEQQLDISAAPDMLFIGF